MSLQDTISAAWAQAEPALKDTLKAQVGSFVSSFSGTAQGAMPAAANVARLLEEAGQFKLQAMRSADPADAQVYTEAAATSVRRAKTLALAEQVIANDAAAAQFEAAAHAVLETAAAIGKVVLQTVVTAAAQGAIAGLTGGKGGGILPFAG